MNCQAVSDVRGRILDLSIGLPGASSDCIAFEGSNLYERFEGGLLNGLTAMVFRERPLFYELLWCVKSPQSHYPFLAFDS